MTSVLPVLVANRLIEKSSNPVDVAPALRGRDAIRELNLATPTLDAVQPDFAELTASRHFIPGDNMVLIANLGAERSHAQVIAVRSARGMVVVTAPFPKVCLVGRNGFARLVPGVQGQYYSNQRH